MIQKKQKVTLKIGITNAKKIVGYSFSDFAGYGEPY